MSECTTTYIIHTAFGVLPGSFQGDAPAGFGKAGITDHFNGFSSVFVIKIIDQDAVNPASIKYLLNFIQVASLADDLEVQFLIFQIFPC